MGMGVGYLDVEEMRSTQPDEKLVSGGTYRSQVEECQILLKKTIVNLYNRQKEM